MEYSPISSLEDIYNSEIPGGDRFFKYIVMVDYLKIWETCVRIGPNNQETGPAIGG